MKLNKALKLVRELLKAPLLGKVLQSSAASRLLEAYVGPKYGKIAVLMPALLSALQEEDSSSLDPILMGDYSAKSVSDFLKSKAFESFMAGVTNSMLASMKFQEDTVQYEFVKEAVRVANETGEDIGKVIGQFLSCNAALIAEFVEDLREKESVVERHPSLASESWDIKVI